MKRLLPVLGALVLVGAVVAAVVWQRPDARPVSLPLKDFVVQYADGSTLWSSKDGDPASPLVAQVLGELRGQASLDLDRLRRAGGIVLTTIDPKAQAAGTSLAATSAPTSRYGLTAVDPATGGVLAYVPGAPVPGQIDLAGGVLRETGAAFFPINVIAGMRQGKQLDAVLDGRPRTIAGVRITDNATCGERCTVRDALIKSSRVAMLQLVAGSEGTGTRVILDAARQAGVPETVVVDGKSVKLLIEEGAEVPNIAVALGEEKAAMRPLDLTTMYATFAAGGVWHRTHFVTKVSDEDGSLLYQVTKSDAAAFDPDVAVSKEISSRVTTVLKDGSPCAGAVCRVAAHMSTPEDPSPRAHAWATGYTDRMAITVLAEAVDGRMPVETALPQAIWQEFAARA